MDLTAKAFAFPFTAILAQPAVRLALTLAAVNPRIGGVLIRGEKGAAKSTAVRALASLLPGVPFVELPLGATEERVTGTLDVGEALRTGNRRFEPGLLARAHGGILSIDEVNLLPDHLVDLILDASAMGVNHVERDGVSHAHPAVFILAGTMNPEEGELRPQLLDRFALSVTVEPVRDVATRSAIVRQRMAFDTDPAGFVDAYKQAEIALRDNLSRARGAVGSVTIPDDVMDRIVGLCLGIGVDGMRADLATCRAAQALAALEGRSEVTIEDVRLVAPFTLAHRRRRGPLDPYGVDPTEIDRHLSPDATRTMGSAHVSGPQADVETDPQEPDLSGETAQPSQTTGLSGSSRQVSPSRRPSATVTSGGERDGIGHQPDRSARREIGQAPITLSREMRPDIGQSDTVHGPMTVVAPTAMALPISALVQKSHRMRSTHSSTQAPLAARDHQTRSPVQAWQPGLRPDAFATLVTMAVATGVGGNPTTYPASPAALRGRKVIRQPETLDAILLDASGSMRVRAPGLPKSAGGAPLACGARSPVVLADAKGVALAIAENAYRRRARLALVTCTAGVALVSVRPTRDVRRIADAITRIESGGSSPLAKAIGLIGTLGARQATTHTSNRDTGWIITDGRATGGCQGIEDASNAARQLRAFGWNGIVIDAETDAVRLHGAQAIANALGGPCLPLHGLT